MDDDDIIWPGDPGTSWTNDGTTVAYQFFCSFLATSCDYCMSLDTAIKLTPWPIPQHDHCACWEEEIFPGDDSAEFGDFRDKLRIMSDANQKDALGHSLWRLIRSGLVAFEDVVTPDRIRSLAEVVSRYRLTVQEMVNAGVSRAVAERAANASRADVAEIIKRHRDELARRVEAAAVHANALRNAVAAAVGGTPLVGTGGLVGPSVQPAVSPVPNLPSGDPEIAAALAEYLKKWPNTPTLDALIALLIAEDAERVRQGHETAVAP